MASINTNGIIITGFITIGNPNVTGSLISKIPAGNDKRPKVRKDFSFERHMMITKANVAPAPPKLTNQGMKPNAVI